MQMIMSVPALELLYHDHCDIGALITRTPKSLILTVILAATVNPNVVSMAALNKEDHAAPLVTC